MSSPKRDSSESMLIKLDPTQENGLERTRDSLESFFGNKAINSSNAGLVASALLTATPMSSSTHATEWTIEASLTEIHSAVMQQFGEAVKAQLSAGVPQAHIGEISAPTVTYDAQSNQIRVVIKTETNSPGRHTSYKTNGSSLKTKKLSIKTNATIEEAGYTAQNADAEMVAETTCTKKTCVQASDDERLNGEKYLSSTIDKVLRENEKQMVQRTRNVLKNANKWEPDEEGTSKWKILEES